METLLIEKPKEGKRFWNKVLFTTDCWEWLSAKLSGGYGTYYLNGKNLLSHRVSYEMYHGKIPE